MTSLPRYLKAEGYKVVTTEEYIMAEGDLPICLVAHLDTVFKEPPIDLYFDQVQETLWSPDGLGTDDRAGVYAILKIIKAGYTPHIIFTTDEEQGGLGARALVRDNVECPFKELKAIIELDRSGSNDCVFYDCYNPDFISYIEKYGFEEQRGSFSDISFIAPYWGVAAVNLSVGYYYEHSEIELLKFNELHNTINKVEEILNDIDTMPAFKYMSAKKAIEAPVLNECICCSKKLENEFYEFTYENFQYRVCKDCYKQYYFVQDEDLY